MRNIPSMKTLRDGFGRYVELEYGDGAGAKLRELRKALVDWRDRTGVTRNEVLNLANEILGGHGLERIDSEPKDYRSDPGASAVYVNMGDTYAATLLFDEVKVSFRVLDWGTYVETEERRGNRFR